MAATGAGGAPATQRAVVAVIGLGYAGVCAVPLLAKAGFHVVGIDRRAAFFHRVALPLALVDTGFADRLYYPYERLLKRHQGEFVQGTVSRIGDKAVHLDDGRTIAFDYALVTTGSRFNSTVDTLATTADEMVADLRRRHDALAQAKDILVVGGGMAGVEVAGFLAEHFRDATVTLVHGGAHLLSNQPRVAPKFIADVTAKLQGQGVVIALNERLDLPPAEQLREPARRTLRSTTSGREFASDVQILTVGSAGLNTDFVRSDAAWRDAVTAEGAVRVNEFLQVVGRPHVFACGDIIDVSDLNLAHPAFRTELNARVEAMTAADNIKRLHNGTALKAWGAMHLMATAAVGRTTGTVQGLPFDQWSVTGWLGNLFTRIKSGDFYASAYTPEFAPL